MSLYLSLSPPPSSAPPSPLSPLSLAAASQTDAAPPVSPCLSQSVCVYLSLFLCLSVPPSVYLSPPPSIHPSLRPCPPPSRCGHAPGAPEMRLRNVSFLTVLLFGLCGLVSLSWYTAFSSSRGKTQSRSVPLCVYVCVTVCVCHAGGVSQRSVWSARCSALCCGCCRKSR